MATSTGQRIGIWVIAVAMIGGTLAGFIAMILAPSNEAAEQKAFDDAVAQYQTEYQTYQSAVQAQQAAVDARAKTLSKKYFAKFSKYQKQVKKFDKASVKKLDIAMLVKSDGKKITDDTTYLTYYIGFRPDGKVFDGSINKKALKAPLIVRPGGVIEGWGEAMKGKSIGGTYRITIPSDKAYGEAGSGENIPANTPLTFIVMPIETIKTLNEPEIPEELLQ